MAFERARRVDFSGEVQPLENFPCEESEHHFVGEASLRTVPLQSEQFSVEKEEIVDTTGSYSEMSSSRSTEDYDDGNITAPVFVDHFSLGHPSNTVRFRGARVHVYESANEQILLEDYRSTIDNHAHKENNGNEDDDNGKSRSKYSRHNIVVKRLDSSGFSLRVLRLAYTLVSLLIFGLLFATCFQIILFLFFNLLTSFGLTSDGRVETDRMYYNLELVGTLLSAPVFLYGLSSLMTIASAFVQDAWSGGHLIRAIFRFPNVVTDLVYFFFFLFVPAFTFIVALLTKVNDSWMVTCMAWCLSTLFVFCCFGLGIVWCEMTSASELLSIHYSDPMDVIADDVPSWKEIPQNFYRAFLITQRRKYAGETNQEFLVSGEDVPPEGGFSFSDAHDPIRVRTSLYARLTRMSCLRCMFEDVNPPKRMYSIEEVRDVLPFVTYHNWSLESQFCGGTRERSIMSAWGPSALTRHQVITGAACNIIGTVFAFFLFIGILVWMNAGGWEMFSIAAILCFVFCLLPMVRTNSKILTLYSDINKEDEYIEEGGGDVVNEDEENIDNNKDNVIANSEEVDVKRMSSFENEKKQMTTLFRLWEATRITEPKSWVCWTGLALEFILLFLMPITVLFVTGNTPVGVIFLVLSIFSFIRHYFNPAAILCELGSIDKVDIEKVPGKGNNYSSLQGAGKTLELKSRLANIIGDITMSRSVKRWMWFFGVLLVATFGLFSAASTGDDGLGDRPPIVLVNDYYYPGENTLQYPTCNMGKGFELNANGKSTSTALRDYSILSALAYEVTNVTDYLLPQWFGEGKVVDEDELVQQYRVDSDTTAIPIYFKLFTFPDSPNDAVVAIRGSQTSWDWMVNMQLWSAAGLAQVVKWFTPYGWLWDPILDWLVSFVNFVQSDSVDKVSYYTVTTAFVNEFRKMYEGICITGASLGGGLAIITGAQARAPAVAISGLGAELLRHTLNPPVSLEDINEWVFNWIPDRDYIARLGGRPRQHQEAQCSAGNSDLFGCHSMWRSVCEINYRCGTNGRPVVCQCVFNFGYPEPAPIGTPTRNFKKACYEEEQAFLAATGSSLTSGWWDDS